MPFNSTLGRSELSFYSLVRASPTNSCLRTLAEPASKNEQTTRTRWTIWNSQWISKRHDNASIATCLDFRLHTMAMTDGKVSKEEKKQMDQAGFLNIVSISLGPGCLIHIMFFIHIYCTYVVLCRQTYVCDFLWIYSLILIDIDSYSLTWSNHYQVSDPFDICHGMNLRFFRLGKHMAFAQIKHMMDDMFEHADVGKLRKWPLQKPLLSIRSGC